MKKLIPFVLMLAFSATSHATENFATYTNARFAYSIKYPANLFVPQGEADNGDGQVFLAKAGDAKVTVWGRWNIAELAHMCHALYGLDNPDSPNITYKFSKNNISIASGYKGREIFYNKYVVAGDRCLGLVVEYSIAGREKYDSLVGDIAKSMRDMARH